MQQTCRRQGILREVPEVEPGPERFLVLWASVLVMVSLALSAGFCNTARHHISTCKECMAIGSTLASGQICSAP